MFELYVSFWEVRHDGGDVFEPQGNGRGRRELRLAPRLLQLDPDITADGEGARVGGGIRVEEHHLEAFIVVSRAIDAGGDVLPLPKVLPREGGGLCRVHANRQLHEVVSMTEGIQPLLELRN